MPNWCEGALRIKGKTENIVKMVLECMIPVDMIGNEMPRLENDGGVIRSDFDCWIKGTHRGFAEAFELWIDDDEESVVAIKTKFAWDVSAKELSLISKQYELDLRLYAFEAGMEFNRDIEIIHGEITKDNEITFDDYTWGCICPIAGG